MQGFLPITTAGALSLVQRPIRSPAGSMPQYAIAHDHVRAALTVDEIGHALVRSFNGA